MPTEANKDHLERILNPTLQRDDLTPTAREPKDEPAGAGFGSYYQGPEVDREDEPVLSTERLERVNGQVEPVHSTYPTRDLGWSSAESRDFRQEDSNADYERGEMEADGDAGKEPARAGSG